MADYDSGQAYDNGVTYDDVAPPTTFKRMPKVKVKLNLDRKSDTEVLTFAQAHGTAMTGNANFTTPLPSAANFTTAVTTYQTALGAFNTAQAAAKQATQVKETARAALESVLTARGNYVELTANSAADPVAVVESAAFSVKAAAGASQMPDPVGNLSITAGDNAGELDLQWDPANGAKTYEVQTSPDPFTDTSWTPRPSPTKSKTVILGLTSGAKMWARVRGVGPGGTGAWSEPAAKIVP